MQHIDSAQSSETDGSLYIDTISINWQDATIQHCFSKGTVLPFKLFKKVIEAQIVLREISTLDGIDENTILTIEGYLWKMYASKNICKERDLRGHNPEEIWKNKSEHRLNCVKKLYSS